MANSKTNPIHSPFKLHGLFKFFSISCHRSFDRALWTFCELGIPDLMFDNKAPITALQLSQLNGNNWNAEFLYRLLRIMADVDILKVSNDDTDNTFEHSRPEDTVQYQLTDDGILLTSNHSSKGRDMVRLDLNPLWEQATIFSPSIIKFGYNNGNTFEQAFGCNMYDFLQKEENKEFASIFNNSMVAHSNMMVSSLVALVDFSRFHTLVDIGGGLGTLLSSILENYKHVNGILFDLPHVIEEAKTFNPNEFQQKQIEPSRYQFIAGDIFKHETVPSADAYILKFIIHNWDDEKSVEILRSIRDANKDRIQKQITVFIAEMVIVSNERDNWEAHVMDFEMLTLLNAKERSFSEYINLLKKSGYELKQTYKTKGVMSIIEAVTTIDE